MKTILALLFALAWSPSAFAGEENASLALQLAKRVASIENSKDLPSRAFWFSQRVAANQRLIAFQANKPAKRKRVISIQN